MGAVFRKAQVAPCKGYVGVNGNTGIGWLLWVVNIFMVRLFSIRTHPPLSLIDSDLRRGGLGDQCHCYRLTGAVGGAFGILSALVGAPKTWRTISRWSAFPVMVDRGVAWCNYRPNITMVPQVRIEEAIRNWDNRFPPRHADFPGHRVHPLEIYMEDEGLASPDDENEEEFQSPQSPMPGMQDPPASAGYETPRKRLRIT